MKKKLSVVKSNDLIETSYNLGKRELLWILMQLSEINTDPKDGDVLLPEFKMYGRDIMKQLNFGGVRRVTKSSDVLEIMDNLNSNPIKWEKGTITEKVAWISYMRYDHEKDLYQWTIPKQLTPFLVQLKKNFTKYTLDNIIRLNNAHAINLYEVLKRYQFQKNVTIEIERLKFWLGLEGKYNRWRDFKKRVLEPCKEQINLFTDIEFAYKELKRGRVIYAVNIEISNNLKFAKTLKKSKGKIKEQKFTEPAQPTTPKGKKLHQKLKAFALSEANIKMVMEEYSDDKVWEAIRYTEAAKKVRNKAGFMLKYLKEHWVNVEKVVQQSKDEKTIGIAIREKKIAALNQKIEQLRKELMSQKSLEYDRLFADDFVLTEIYEAANHGFFATSLKNKSATEAIKDTGLARAAMEGTLEKKYPEIFAGINQVYEARIKQVRRQIIFYNAQPYQYFLKSK